MTTQFFVPGVPRTKGSSHSFVNPKTKSVIYQHDNKNLQAWQSFVSYTAREKGCRVSPVAVALEIDYYFPRPKSHFRSSGALKPGAPRDIISKPDIDKLERAILDALTGIAYTDDSQVVRCNHAKFYTDSIHQNPGAWIRVSTELPERQPLQTRIPLPGREQVDDIF